MWLHTLPILLLVFQMHIVLFSISASKLCEWTIFYLLHALTTKMQRPYLVSLNETVVNTSRMIII